MPQCLSKAHLCPAPSPSYPALLILRCHSKQGRQSSVGDCVASFFKETSGGSPGKMGPISPRNAIGRAILPFVEALGQEEAVDYEPLFTGYISAGDTWGIAVIKWWIRELKPSRVEKLLFWNITSIFQVEISVKCEPARERATHALSELGLRLPRHAFRTILRLQEKYQSCQAHSRVQTLHKGRRYWSVKL